MKGFNGREGRGRTVDMGVSRVEKQRMMVQQVGTCNQEKLLPPPDLEGTRRGSCRQHLGREGAMQEGPLTGAVSDNFQRPLEGLEGGDRAGVWQVLSSVR